MSGETILVPVSFGELFDKITILRIKSEMMKNESQLRNVRHELSILEAVASKYISVDIVKCGRLVSELHQVNSRLWVIEDEIRGCERASRFDGKFIELARSVYHQNDLRAKLKKEINNIFGSDIVEEKSYEPY